MLPMMVLDTEVMSRRLQYLVNKSHVSGGMLTTHMSAVTILLDIILGSMVLENITIVGTPPHSLPHNCGVIQPTDGLDLLHVKLCPSVTSHSPTLKEEQVKGLRFFRKFRRQMKI